MAKIKCPGIFCKSKDIQVISKKPERFKVKRGVLGALIAGSELGILAGIESAQHTYRCNKCNKTWKE
jgi:hypothetical protein